MYKLAFVFIAFVLLSVAAFNAPGKLTLNLFTAGNFLSQNLFIIQNSYFSSCIFSCISASSYEHDIWWAKKEDDCSHCRQENFGGKPVKEK